MDRESQYNWTLTADELDNIWWALPERDDRLREEAKHTTDASLKEVKLSLAKKTSQLIWQINRLRSRW